MWLPLRLASFTRICSSLALVCLKEAMLHPGTFGHTMCIRENWFGFFTLFLILVKLAMIPGRIQPHTNIWVERIHGLVLVWMKSGGFSLLPPALFHSIFTEEEEKGPIFLATVF